MTLPVRALREAPPTQIDLITALKLLEATAQEEVKPILKAAIEEIKRLREETEPDWSHTTEHVYANNTQSE